MLALLSSLPAPALSGEPHAQLSAQSGLQADVEALLKPVQSFAQATFDGLAGLAGTTLADVHSAFAADPLLGTKLAAVAGLVLLGAGCWAFARRASGASSRKTRIGGLAVFLLALVTGMAAAAGLFGAGTNPSSSALRDAAQRPSAAGLREAWIDPPLALLRETGLDPAIGLVLLLGACALALLLRAKAGKGDGAQDDAEALSQYVQAPRRLGWATILLVFGCGTTLAAAIPLAGAAVAPGFVSPDGHRKTVQHLEGGIVRRIHVREGDLVRAGDRLVTIEDTLARANMAELSERLVHFLAIEARLLAEQAGVSAITPPDAPMIHQAALANALRGQETLFISRRETRSGRERILGQRILQLHEESEGLRQVIASQNEQEALIKKEIATVETLLRQGLERLPRLLSLQRVQAELGGARASNFARIAKNKQAVGEAEMELLTMRQQDREKVNEELNTVRAELASLRSKLPARTDVLDRTLVTAPIDGIVMNVRVTTESGVVRPGEALLEIVPQKASLIVDARVRPIDVDVVRPGMGAKVVFSAFAQRNLPQIDGRLRSISADRMTDERTGESYFIAKVEVDAAKIRELNSSLELVAGMPAEVFILTGERTALDYLVRPFLESINKSFRET
ncbi:HlyD family type I secretion periplasmic adaptor subunit [Methylorubrum aminovorans]